jgi:hypothetical protein
MVSTTGISISPTDITERIRNKRLLNWFRAKERFIAAQSGISTTESVW